MSAAGAYRRACGQRAAPRGRVLRGRRRSSEGGRLGQREPVVVAEVGVEGRPSKARVGGGRKVALLLGQLELGQPAPALDTEQVTERRAGRSAGASAPRGSGSWPSSAPRSVGFGAEGGGASPGFGGRAPRPDRVRQRQAASPVSARRAGRSSLAPPDPGVGRRDDDHLGDVRLDDPLDFPGAAGHLKRDDISSAPRRSATNSICSGLASIRPAERTPPPSAIVRDGLPAGTGTFLFTDVEGSTRLLHELGAEAYAEALAEHRRIVHEACARSVGSRSTPSSWDR